jgi:xyloglucan-specific exo-beta-1,4-glucanase
VVVSNDAGLTWTDYSTGLPNIPCNDIISYSGTSDGLFLAMDIGVYYRDASLSSWQLINTNLPNARVFDLSIQGSSGKLRAGLYGRGVWETDILSVGVKESSKSLSVNLYPNPSFGKFKITLQGSWKYQNCLLSICNALGQELISQKITSPVLDMNTEKWGSGVYYIKISEGNDVVNKKVVVQ